MIRKSTIINSGVLSKILEISLLHTKYIQLLQTKSRYVETKKYLQAYQQKQGEGKALAKFPGLWP